MKKSEETFPKYIFRWLQQIFEVFSPKIWFYPCYKKFKKIKKLKNSSFLEISQKYSFNQNLMIQIDSL